MWPRSVLTVDVSENTIRPVVGGILDIARSAHLMAFPDSPRVLYKRNPLAEVVATLKFPPILKIDSDPPAGFQDIIRVQYPQYTDVAARPILPPNIPPQISTIIQGFGGVRSAGAKHQFSSQDETWRVTLTRELIELKTVSYGRWEEFRDRITALIDALERTYAPNGYTRVDLRYVDVVRRSLLQLRGARWADLLNAQIAGELGAPELADDINSMSRQIHCKFGDGDSYLTLKTGLIETAAPDKEQCFLIDSDFHTHQRTERVNVLTTLSGFNRSSGRFFRWCIQQRLHDALGPEPI